MTRYRLVLSVNFMMFRYIDSYSKLIEVNDNLDGIINTLSYRIHSACETYMGKFLVRHGINSYQIKLSDDTSGQIIIDNGIHFAYFRAFPVKSENYDREISYRDFTIKAAILSQYDIFLGGVTYKSTKNIIDEALMFIDAFHSNLLKDGM